MWKWRKKQQADVIAEEPPSSEGKPADAETEDALSAKEGQQVSTVAEETPSVKEAQQAGTVTRELPPAKEEEKAGAVVEEPPSVKEEQKIGAVTEEAPSGVFIFGKKIEGGFKKFITVFITIFLLPPAVLFGLMVITIVVLIAFPLISIAFPITLLTLCILLIALPVVIPFVTVISLITGKGKVQFGLKNKKFAIKILGITLPPYAGR